MTVIGEKNALPYFSFIVHHDRSKPEHLACKALWPKHCCTFIKLNVFSGMELPQGGTATHKMLTLFFNITIVQDFNNILHIAC